MPSQVITEVDLMELAFHVATPPSAGHRCDEFWRLSTPDGGGQWHAGPVQRPNTAGDE